MLLVCCTVLCITLSCFAVQDIDGVDDAKEYAEVMQALMDIGVRQDDITTLLRTLSGILWLGNLKIEAVHANDSSRIKADAALSNASELLGLEQGALVHAITHKEVRGGALSAEGQAGGGGGVPSGSLRMYCACVLTLCSITACCNPLSRCVDLTVGVG
jgi:hypothetical protein